MKYGIFCTSTKEIVLEAETLEEAQKLMSRLRTEEGQKFFGMTDQGKEIWTISAFFEPLEKVLDGE